MSDDMKKRGEANELKDGRTSQMWEQLDQAREILKRLLKVQYKHGRGHIAYNYSTRDFRNWTITYNQPWTQENKHYQFPQKTLACFTTVYPTKNTYYHPDVLGHRLVLPVFMLSLSMLHLWISFISFYAVVNHQFVLFDIILCNCNLFLLLLHSISFVNTTKCVSFLFLINSE